MTHIIAPESDRLAWSQNDMSRTRRAFLRVDPQAWACGVRPALRVIFRSPTDLLAVPNSVWFCHVYDYELPRHLDPVATTAAINEGAISDLLDRLAAGHHVNVTDDFGYLDTDAEAAAEEILHWLDHEAPRL